MSQDAPNPSLFKSHYRIDSPRLIIRSAYAQDATAVYQLLASLDNNPHTAVDPTLSPEVFSRRIAKWEVSAAAGENAFMVVEARDTGALIGFGGFNSLPTKPALDGSGKQVLVGDIGILIDKAHWRKGYAAEATCATTEFAFGYLGCGFMNMDTKETNKPLQGLMSRLGLGQFKTLRQSWQNKDEMLLYYEWDKPMWEIAKADMKAKGTWPLGESL